MPLLSGFLQFALSALAFLVVITIVITFHELGHYWAARLCKVKIDRFSLGFGPTLFAWTNKRTGVEWRLAALPLGGYVKFAGDANAAGVPDADDLAHLKAEIVEAYGPGAERNYYHFKPVWQRAFIAAAGPFANFVLAIAVFAGIYGVLGDIYVPTRVAGVDANSPAAAAGFQVGDKIIRAAGDDVQTSEDFLLAVKLNAETPIQVDIERAGKPMTLTVTPRRAIIKDSFGARMRGGKIGMALAPGPVSEYRQIRFGFFGAIEHGFKRTVFVLRTSISYIGRIFVGKESGDQLSGPIGTASAAGKVTAQAMEGEGSVGLKAAMVVLQLVNFVALISVGIGFLNLLPIPVLDGGHLLFYAYESVARKPLGARVQEVGYQLGLALIVGLMLFATWNDLQKLILGGPSS